MSVSEERQESEGDGGSEWEVLVGLERLWEV